MNALIKKYNYNMEGFFEPVYKYGEGVAGGLEGQRFGLPIRIGACWVFYRTDLIKEFPKTWDEYYKLLGEQTTGGKYGVAFAGVAAQLVKIFLARYWSQGDPLMKPDWTPLINSEKGVKAVDMMLDALKKYAPPGMLGWDNPDASNAFLNGDVAVLEGWASFILPSLDDPTKSKVVGKWDVAPVPGERHRQPDPAQHGHLQGEQERGCRLRVHRLLHRPRELEARDPRVQGGVAAQGHLERPGGAEGGAVTYRRWPSSTPWASRSPPACRSGLSCSSRLAEGLSSAMSEQATPQAALDATAKKWTDAINQAKPTFEYKE